MYIYIYIGVSLIPFFEKPEYAGTVGDREPIVRREINDTSNNNI